MREMCGFLAVIIVTCIDSVTNSEICFTWGKFCRAISKQAQILYFGFIKCFEKETSHAKNNSTPFLGLADYK
jgi:hypothetical protein